MLLKFVRNIFVVMCVLYLTSFNPLNTHDRKKQDYTVISTNGFYYIRSGVDGYLYAIKTELGRHKRVPYNERGIR